MGREGGRGEGEREARLEVVQLSMYDTLLNCETDYWHYRSEQWDYVTEY